MAPLVTLATTIRPKLTIPVVRELGVGSGGGVNSRQTERSINVLRHPLAVYSSLLFLPAVPMSIEIRRKKTVKAELKVEEKESRSHTSGTQVAHKWYTSGTQPLTFAFFTDAIYMQITKDSNIDPVKVRILSEVVEKRLSFSPHDPPFDNHSTTQAGV